MSSEQTSVKFSIIENWNILPISPMSLVITSFNPSIKILQKMSPVVLTTPSNNITDGTYASQNKISLLKKSQVFHTILQMNIKIAPKKTLKAIHWQFCCLLHIKWIHCTSANYWHPTTGPIWWDLYHWVSKWKIQYGPKWDIWTGSCNIHINNYQTVSIKMYRNRGSNCYNKNICNHSQGASTYNIHW